MLTNYKKTQIDVKYLVQYAHHAWLATLFSRGSVVALAASPKDVLVAH